MSKRAASIALVALLATGCGADPDVDVAKPEAYARQLAVQPANGGTLQRLTLPPSLIVASKRRDLGDVRLFDARGRLVGMALLPAGASGVRAPDVSLPVYPVLGGSQDEKLQDTKLSVRVANGGAVQAITVDSAGSSGATMPAAILDARKLTGAVAAIRLRARIPTGRPVPLTLLTSSDLKDWTPLAEKVLFQPAAGAPLLGGDSVAVGGADLGGRFVGVSWAGSRDVVLEGASAVLAEGAKANRVAVPTAPPKLTDPHELTLNLPDNGRLAALRVTAAASDGVVPVRLLARSPDRDDWTLIAAATLSPDRGASTIELPDAPLASVKLEADRRTGGFSEAPRVELLFDPVELVVSLSGTPPYRVAVGQAAAPPSFLALSEIAPEMTAAALAELPAAIIVGADRQPPAVDVQSELASGSRDRRKLLLWAALLFSTLLLAGAAYRLLRPVSEDKSPDQ